MIVYVTRPDNHELVMGGWRSVKVWVEKPSYYHTPLGGFSPPRDNINATFQDTGWAVDCERNRSQKFKPLVKQDAVLENNAWALIAWSACPRSVSFKDWATWADFIEDPNDPFSYSNWENLMWHRTRDSDLMSNLHYKRFLMQVNLRTNECEIVIPTVHIYHVGKPYYDKSSSETIQTQDITIELATRTNYECPELNNDLPF